MLKTTTFKQLIWDFYKQNKRDFPWRSTTDPYKILVSEVMLQQTQTYRVSPKYEAWIKRFPDFKTLADAPFSEVLKYWQGLGYNRRAMYLQKTAQEIIKQYEGKVPKDPEELVKLPGIGKATAASIIVFAYNVPLPFIETNIRRVFIHHFFSPVIASKAKQSHEIASSPTAPRDDDPIHDNQLLPLIEATLDKQNPREWYYALMDYGSHLAKHPPAGGINPNRKSKHYTKQSKFQGSLRQVRGKILKLLIKNAPMIPITKAKKEIDAPEEMFDKALDQLKKEGFIKISKDQKISIRVNQT